MATAVKISGAKMDSKSANTWKKDFSCNRCQSIPVRAIKSRGSGCLYTLFASFFLSSGWAALDEGAACEATCRFLKPSPRSAPEARAAFSAAMVLKTTIWCPQKLQVETKNQLSL